MRFIPTLLAAFLSIQPVMAGFELASPNRTACIVIPPGEPECVRIAADDLARDTHKITGRALQVVTKLEDCGANAVLLVSLNQPGSAAVLERIAPDFAKDLKGKWEAYRVEIVPRPAGMRLVIAGSDERGTMFGLYAFIEKYLGVDPLYYWTSRTPASRDTLAWDEVKLIAGEPAFRFRGWFVNDEDLLTEFQLDGGERRLDYPFYQKVVSPSVSARVFEAMLRLQYNVVIPASFVDLRNPAEEQLVADAARRGLFVSMHHVEPVGVSGFTFNNYWKDRNEDVPFSFTQKPEKFREIWRDYAKRWSKYGSQVIWQLGLRGIADRPVWTADPGVPASDKGRGKLISDAMSAQWEIIRSVDPRPQPLATTTLWMEGAELHAKGHLKFPEGISVIFSDNSPGWQWQDDFRNVRREPGRPYGVYYHHQLWNVGPHLVQAVSPQKTRAMLQQVIERGSTNYAMLNVSNVREFVLGLDASARMLRDFKSFDPDKFLAGWCEQRFGAQAKAAEEAYRKHFAGFVANDQTAERAMLDGEWMQQATLLAKSLQVKLGAKAKLRHPIDAAKVLNELRPQRAKFEQAIAASERVASELRGEPRVLLETNLLAQQKIMLGLLQWVEHMAEASVALDANDKPAAAKHVAAAKESIAVVEAGKALASQREFADWYRGDRKMNMPKLSEWTAKIQEMLKL